jgi:hypothetical protein
MPDERSSAVATVTEFIEAINRGDADLITAHHRLEVFDEPPLEGRGANVDAWRSYLSLLPR